MISKSGHGRHSYRLLASYAKNRKRRMSLLLSREYAIGARFLQAERKEKKKRKHGDPDARDHSVVLTQTDRHGTGEAAVVVAACILLPNFI